MEIIIHGLVNRANGIIRYIIYDDILKQPHTILVEFDNYSGPCFFKDDDTRNKWISINPVSIFNANVCASWSQYPIRLSFALTMHKSQGQTLEKVVIDFLGQHSQELKIIQTLSCNLFHLID